MRRKITVWVLVSVIALIGFATSFLGWKGFVGVVAGILTTSFAIAALMIAEPQTDTEETDPENDPFDWIRHDG